MCIMAQEGWSTPLLYTKNQNVVYKKNQNPVGQYHRNMI